MSQGYLAMIREWLSTGCLYMQSAHVDYLQALGFLLLKPALGAIQIPAQRITTESSLRCGSSLTPLPTTKVSSTHFGHVTKATFLYLSFHNSADLE